MRRVLAVIVSSLFLAGLPVLSQEDDDIPYTIELKDFSVVDRHEGIDALFIKVKFVVGVKGNARDHKNYKIHIFEDDKRIAIVDLPAPKPDQGLSVILAVDTSAKIEENWDQVLKAADVFFKSLPKEAECGLILFNDKIRKTINLSLDRSPLDRAIHDVKAAGGNACLTATLKAIDMLEGVPANKAKAVVLISNGLDQYSSKDAKKKILAAAAGSQVVVHTIGIGEATRPQSVNVVLVLDHSGSMESPVDDADPTPKIQGLHRAGKAFIEKLPPSTRTTLIPFGSVVGTAEPFRVVAREEDKKSLIAEIEALKPRGETALFDAVFSALATLEADNAPGKRAVLAMTDGIDNISRRRADEVIERAKDANVALFMLGFGRDTKDRKELDSKTMTLMAEQPATGGRYLHAADQKELLDYFEKLAFKINEQGIDADALREIAAKSSGTYSHARDVTSLPLILKVVNQTLQNREEERIFKAGRQIRDAVPRKVTLKLVRTITKIGADGNEQTESKVVNEESRKVDIKGVVISQMDHLVYLALLGVMGSLIVLPAFFRRKG